MKKWSTTTKILLSVLTIGFVGTGSYLIYKAVKKSSETKGTKSADPVKNERKVIFT